MSTWCLGLLLLVPCQDPAVRDLVEHLRADSPDVRHHAFNRLRALGPTAEPNLRAAAGDVDSEVAARSRILLRSFDLRRTLSHRILQEFPDLPERAAENPTTWLEALQEALEETPEDQPLHPQLTETDLEVLALQALSQVRTANEAHLVLQIVASRQLRGALPALRSMLDHPNPGMRRLALQSLHHFRDPGSLEAIAGLLEDPMMQGQAAWSLGNFGRAGVLPAIRKYLDHPESPVRSAALRTLRNLDTPEAISLLRSRLKDPDLGIQAEAMQLLVRHCGALEALRDLQPILDGNNPDLHLEALSALQCRSSPEVWPSLRRLLRSEENAVRIRLVEYAADVRCRDAKDDLMELLQDPCPEVRGAAAHSLALLRIPESIPELLRLLTDPSDCVREIGLWSLSRLRCRDILACLIDRLRSPDAGVRNATLLLLDHPCWKNAAPAVLPLLEDPDCKVRLEAIQTLLRMDARSQACHLLPLLLKPCDPEAKAVVEVLRQWDLPELRPRLVALASHAKADVRRGAAEILVWTSPAEAAPTFLKLLEDPDEEIRDMAIVGVGRLNLQEAIPVLRKLMNDPARKNSARAAEALCTLKDWDSLGDMLEASITSEALGTLLEQLGDLKCPELVAPLERFLDSEDRHISRSVLALFRRMNHPLATEALRRVTRIVGHPLQLSSISALGHLEDRESIPDLIRLLNTSSSGVPPTTAGALANLGAREAIPALLRRFLDEGAAGKRGLLIVLSRLQAPGLAPHVLKALRSDRPDRVAEAIRAVEILHLTEALPDLIRLSQDDDLTLRPSASEALIRLGDRGEIPKFLGRSSRDLHLLNRFRQPELWERLRTTPQPRTYRGTLGQALTDLASDAGLTLEVHGGEDALKQDLPDNVLRRHGVSTLLEALESLFEPRRVSFVLEQDRLHLLPPEDAEDFWQHWGKQQNSK